MFNAQERISQILKEADELNQQIDFEYRDMIKMNSEERQEKQEIVKTRNKLLEEKKMLERLYFKKVPADKRRFYFYKNFSESELSKTAIELKFEAEFAGGKEFKNKIILFENCRNELFWRLQNKVEVVNGKRKDLQGFKDLPLYKCHDVDGLYELYRSDYDQNYLNKIPNELHVCAMNNSEIIGGCSFDIKGRIWALSVKDDFVGLGIGTALFKKAQKYLNSKNQNAEILIPSNAVDFINHFPEMMKQDEEAEGMTLYLQNDDFYGD